MIHEVLIAMIAKKIKSRGEGIEERWKRTEQKSTRKC
jgi:hypothetical protein